MTSYRTSQGDRLTKSKIDRNIRKAKEIKKEAFLKIHSHFFCETCKASTGILSNSHIISVKYAEETGRTELAWDTVNIIYQCNKCHIELENKGNIEREKIYNERKSAKKECKWKGLHSHMKKVEGRIRCKLCGESL